MILTKTQRRMLRAKHIHQRYPLGTRKNGLTYCKFVAKSSPVPIGAPKSPLEA
jgi:hypothetical protein